MFIALALLRSLIIVVLFHTILLFAQKCRIKKDSQYGFALLFSAYKTMKDKTLDPAIKNVLMIKNAVVLITS